ncbi:DUF4097 domain-containing protein [Nocardioides humilatus]|uniref:DUF4097 domain-containing protein n=1 Tax=Nocardioides humilatus TaxID=2607660 RepID=A0A5B1LMG9_9ACTN|nr:DUF4097 family beta strand repeat-containing protein [Nocardioides humilatus]KAA1421666.1 DUF4097 domain-containing protein [Nocardioides humilatus]
MPDFTFDTPEPVQLHVENNSGHIDVSAADVRTTEVRIEGKLADQVHVVHERDRVSVIAPKNRGIFGDQKLEIDVVVPNGTKVVLRSGSADVRVAGDIANASVKSGSGDVSIERISGVGTIDTGSGDISLAAVVGELRIRSGSGDINAEHLGSATSISTGSGDIRVDRSGGPVVVKTGSGDLDISQAETDVSMTTGSGDTVIRYVARGRITSKGASGDVRIGVAAGTPVWTDITTLSGAVRSGLEGVGEPEPGADFVEIRATTVSGDVHLMPA